MSCRLARVARPIPMFTARMTSEAGPIPFSMAREARTADRADHYNPPLALPYGTCSHNGADPAPRQHIARLRVSSAAGACLIAGGARGARLHRGAQWGGQELVAAAGHADAAAGRRRSLA